MSRFTMSDLIQEGMPVLMSMLLNTIALGHQAVTYGFVANEIRRTNGAKFRNVSARNNGLVAGSLMNRIIEIDPRAPPINTLVVNSRTHLPSSGADWYVKRYLGKGIKYSKLDPNLKRQVLQPVHDEVRRYRKWSKIAHRLFGSQIAVADATEQTRERDGKARRLGFGGPAESEEHKRLKNYVSTHPRRFCAPAECRKGKEEKLLDSGDEIDVWFLVPGEQLAVEVKSVCSTDADLRRGVFQCVKYRSVLAAQAKEEKIDTRIRARLVAEVKVPVVLQSLARILNVEIQGHQADYWETTLETG